MIRFAYPNIDECDRFIGCGRYLTIAPKNLQPDGSYVEALPNIGHFSRITTAASIVAPESLESEQQVYEYKDHPDVGLGESLGLAYLLALISRSRRSRWEQFSQDIWCTGVIDVNQGAPELKSVFRNQFDFKIKAFLADSKASWFFLPFANLTDAHRQQCRKHHARIIPLSQIHTISVQDYFAQKTILPLHGNEVDGLLEWLFPRRIRLQNPRDFTVKIRRAADNAVVGTGIAVSMEGHIVTCVHVVEQAIGCQLGGVTDAPEILVYFPTALSGQAKTRRAKLAAYRAEYRDDLVMLQLIGGPPPLKAGQLAILGDAAESKSHPFRVYGYQRGQHYLAGHAEGKIFGMVEAPENALVSDDPLQLEFDYRHRDMSGAAVLDIERNLVVGIISTFGLPHHESSCGWAINARILSVPPFNLSLATVSEQYEFPVAPHPVQPESPGAELVEAGTLVWLNAPALLRKWVGRAGLLEQLRSDWLHPDNRITSLVGFGGEGKSSLTRKWVEGLRQGVWPDTPVPHAVFGWNFYTHPNTDQFFEAAFRFITAGTLDPQDYPANNTKAHIITGYLYSARHYLFVLDGLETMQYYDEDRYGLLKNTDLRDFLASFASPGNHSFCLINSRLPLPDLMPYAGYKHRDMLSLSPTEGKALLRVLGVGSDEYSDADLDRILAEWGCHALTLSLLAHYIVAYGSIPAALTEGSIYERVSRILTHYDKHLSESERAFLMIFSAFRRPLAEDVFAQVFRPPAGATALQRSLAALEDMRFKAMRDHLSALGLLHYNPQSQSYSAHPLVSAYYREFLHRRDPAELRALHLAIKTYYLAAAEAMPKNPTLEELEPLFEVVYHDCRAGNYDAACKFVVNTLNQGRRYYLPNVLGAWESYLATLRNFFPDRDTSGDPLVKKPEYQTGILHEVGFCVMMSGHLSQVEAYYQRSIESNLRLQRWERVSLSYQNLAELYMQLGRLAESLRAAEQAVNYARQTEDEKQASYPLADLAWMHHLQGHAEEAETCFRQSIAIQLGREQDAFDTVTAYMQEIEAMAQIRDDDEVYEYILHILRYADFLRDGGKFDDARRIITAALTICERYGYKDYTSLSLRILGDLAAASGNAETARAHYDRAVTLICSTTCRDILIGILVARGRWQAHNATMLQAAFDDLREAEQYAINMGCRLYEVNIRLALAQAFLTSAAGSASDACEAAGRELAQARQMSVDMGYVCGQQEAERLSSLLAEIE